MKLFLTLTLSVSFLSIAFAQEKRDPMNGRAVIEQMYNHYKGEWYKNLTFTQKTTTYKEGNPEKEEIWYEALSIPHGLAIKFENMKSGNGLTFKGDSQYVWKDDRIVSRTRTTHVLLILGFSVYIDKPDATIDKLQKSGYDFERFEIDTLTGKKQYVIGNPDICRFWIDAETMLFTKMENKGRKGNMFQTQFNKYEKLGKGWIAVEVVFMRNGVVTSREEYRNIATPKKLPANLLSTTDTFSDLHWE
ncbi:MAG TPA: hypothetical protein PK325_08290 [Cyclobacteriaceae bacterium]|nr:hypothetical protein [Cyclobacteriaceae bacterium]HMV10215.1 hypothetical protein [Cyclobacteriaceae bacterium]HMV89749.1 hypothetical protein [Cyclobacteriaceae bacterium]HMX01552.1 hypothetical protein [Cyclobacteriaceae bacterium]HMX51447.1 hypothetical protein [Cyclobacteriaceae bacterium]